MSTATAFRQTRAFGQPPQPQSIPAETPISYRSYPMNTVSVSTSNTGGWITFVYAQFAIALAMAALSIVFLPSADLQTKGFLLMSYIFTIGATFTLAKTVRDEHETKKLSSRIDDARAEKLLMEVGRS